MSTQPNPDALQHKESDGSLVPFFLMWSFVILLTVLGVRALHGPAPKPATVSADEFSAERALRHVQNIARVPHPVGSAANDGVKNYLLSELTQLGLQPQVFSAIGVNKLPDLVIAAQTQDIIARLPGSVGKPAIMLMAHYDSVSHAPGAADDASGVAAILEIVRAVRQGPVLQHDLIVLFTDGEEAGLLGAEAFAHSHPLVNDVGLIMNFEARGNRGPSLLFETSRNNGPLIEAVAQHAPYPIGSSLFYELYKLLPNDTDFTILQPRHIPGLNFAFGENLEAYHSQLDTPGNLSLASLQHHGSYGLALTRYFGQTDLNVLKNTRGDDVFFDWYGANLVRYRQQWVLPGQVLATILLIIAMVVAIRRSNLHFGRSALALLASLALLVALPLVAVAGYWVITIFLAGRMIVSDSSANLLLLCGLVLLAAAAGVFWGRLFKKRFTTQELRFGGLIIWCLLSWAFALRLPSGSYLLFWPVLIAILEAMVIQLSSKKVQAGASWAVNIASTAATILLFAPVAYLAYVFLTFQLVPVAAAAFLLGLLFLISFPLIDVAGSRRGWAPAPFVACAVVCLAAGIVLSHRGVEHPSQDSIVYSLNADDNTAVWISYDGRADVWTRQFLTEKPQPAHPLPNYLAGLARPLLSAAAPVVQLPAPAIEDVEHKEDGTTHIIKMTLRSPRNARVLYLRFEKDVQPVSIRIGGRDVSLEKGARLGVRLFGISEKGIELELALTTSARPSFWIMDQSSELPLKIQPRPDNITGAGNSDVTFVCRKYAL